MTSKKTPGPQILQDKKGRLLLDIYVQPGASKNAIVGVRGGQLKIKLTSPPIGGAANEQCRTFLAKTLRIPKSAVQIARGQTARRKRLVIEGIKKGELLKALND